MFVRIRCFLFTWPAIYACPYFGFRYNKSDCLTWSAFHACLCFEFANVCSDNASKFRFYDFSFCYGTNQGQITNTIINSMLMSGQGGVLPSFRRLSDFCPNIDSVDSTFAQDNTLNKLIVISQPTCLSLFAKYFQAMLRIFDVIATAFINLRAPKDVWLTRFRASVALRVSNIYSFSTTPTALEFFSDVDAFPLGAIAALFAVLAFAIRAISACSPSRVILQTWYSVCAPRRSVLRSLFVIGYSSSSFALRAYLLYPASCSGLCEFIMIFMRLAPLPTQLLSMPSLLSLSLLCSPSLRSPCSTNYRHSQLFTNRLYAVRVFQAISVVRVFQAVSPQFAFYKTSLRCPCSPSHRRSPSSTSRRRSVCSTSLCSSQIWPSCLCSGLLKNSSL